MSGLHTLYRKFVTKYSNDNFEWVQYVRDHYKRLRSKAYFVDIDQFKMNSLHYRLEDFLSEHNVPIEVNWIVLYLNQLNSEADFIHLTALFLPDMEDLEAMREEFDTVDAHTKSVRRHS